MTTGRPPRLLAIQNDPTCPLGRFGDVFAAAGVDADIRRGFADDGIPTEAAGFDGLIVLGGEMGANDEAQFPWLSDVQRLVRSAVSTEVPALGICLGLQVAARALGGTVARNPHGRALGLVPVGPVSDPDPLLGGLPAGTAAIQWNDDVVTTLPPGARTIGASPDGTPQSVRFGPRAWGVQFHPEATPAIFRSWIGAGGPPGAGAAEGVADGSPSDGSPSDGSPSDGSPTEAAVAALAAISAADDRLADLARLIAGRFLDRCREAAGRR